jgi:outer membrane protein assembly factor BamB
MQAVPPLRVIFDGRDLPENSLPVQRTFFLQAGHRAGGLVLAWTLATQGAGLSASPATEPALIASPEPGWAQWRGPRRDGICDEQGLRRAWPEEGPPRLWTAEGIGRGYSAPIVVGDRVYLTGDFEERLEIIALDLAGRELWRATNGLAWRGQYPGSRSSCTHAGGRLFHKNAHGRVAAFDPDTGRELWAVETLGQFEGRNITWGLSESLLVEGDRVIATVGGERAVMAAFDVRTGRTVWSSPPLRLGEPKSAAHERVATPAGEADSGSYTSPILVQLAGRRQLVNCSLRHVFGVDADTGELLWSQPFPTRFSVIAATPVLVGDGVFVTAPDAGGGRLFRVRGGPDGITAERGWTTQLDSGQGGIVQRDGLLFGSWYRSRNGWAAIAAQSGEVRHELPDLAMGPLLYADERFYWLSQEGEMTLVRGDAEGLEIVSRFRLVEGRISDAWAHPVIHQGRLYLRYHDQLHCFDVRAEQWGQIHTFDN